MCSVANGRCQRKAVRIYSDKSHGNTFVCMNCISNLLKCCKSLGVAAPKSFKIDGG